LEGSTRRRLVARVGPCLAARLARLVEASFVKVAQGFSPALHW